MTRAILVICLAAATILAAGCSEERSEDVSSADASESPDSGSPDVSVVGEMATEVPGDAVVAVSEQTTGEPDDSDSTVHAPGGEEPLSLEMTPAEEETASRSDAPSEEPDRVSLSGLRVIRAYICKGIEQSEPTEAGRSFLPEGDGVGRICCFSEIGGAAEPDSVFHVWYWGDRNMGRVPLEVKSSRWRTWSKKKVLDEWRGEWHVDIVDRDGLLLERLRFSIE